MKQIIPLPANIINQIAAGEVVKRPSSILKELIENSIDSNANSITVRINNGGKTYISIIDDGDGIVKEDLYSITKAHYTSKLANLSLDNIQYLGFRGEAISSICAVADVEIISQKKGSKTAYKIASNNNILSDISPHGSIYGTKISVYNLFSSIPARLKFLRSDSTEANHSFKIFKQLALSNPRIEFKLLHNDKLIYHYKVPSDETNILDNRVRYILGENFYNNSIYIQSNKQEYNILGYISQPTYFSSYTDYQYLIVNGRVVKDRLLAKFIQLAYEDTLVKGKYSRYILFLWLPEDEIDVNVSPDKTEIRIKDISKIRSFIINTIRNILRNDHSSTNNHVSNSMMNIQQNANAKLTLAEKPTKYNYNVDNSQSGNKINYSYYKENYNKISTKNNINHLKVLTENPIKLESNLLGEPLAQIHKNWIISQTNEGFLIIDQHAAAERITFEKLKKEYEKRDIIIQYSLSPTECRLSVGKMLIFEEYKEYINKLGVISKKSSDNTIIIEGIPSIIGNIEPIQFLNNLLNDLEHITVDTSINLLIEKILAKIACHGSIRAGHIMSIAEMNSLLRKMEETPHYAQCPHGRPTFSKFKISDLEKIFLR